MNHTITLIPGDGIGPEVSKAVQVILAAAGVSIDWEEIKAIGDIDDRSS
jgi:isocitrate dehydrogenase (NAD+)